MEQREIEKIISRGISLVLSIRDCSQLVSTLGYHRQEKSFWEKKVFF